MTFAPVLPPVVLLVIAAVVIALRLLTMRQLHASAGARWTTVWRWAGLTLAVLLILIAAARPGVEHGERGSAVAQQSAENTNVFFLVDRSADSAVEDYADRQSRMSGIRNDIEALIDQYPRARFALVAFASRSSLDWPLSEDAWSLRPEVARLAPYAANDTTEDVNAAAAANVLRYQLIAAGQQSAGAVDGGAVFGYGAARNEPGLRRIAEQLGLPYVDRDDGRPISESAPDSGAPQSGAGAATSSGTADRTELYWVFTLLAAVLILFELFAGIRDLRRTRSARRDVTP